MSHLHTTPVTVTICLRCRAVILTGWAEGLRVRADPTPINRIGLITAILATRPTYRLTRSGLIHLDQERIRSANRGPVLADHRCQQPIPAEHRDTTHPDVTTETTEGIPF